MHIESLIHDAIPFLWVSVVAIPIAWSFKLLIDAYNDPVSVPGPLLARFTGMVAEYHWVMGTRPQYVHRLHQRYGPIVRVTPDEIDVCDIDAVHEMYKAGSGFLKSQWYDKLTINGVKNVFSVRDPKAHSVRRRLLSAPMTDTSLERMHGVIDEKICLAVHRMQLEYRQRGAADVFKWWYFMSTDLIGELTFGHSFKLLENGEKNQMATDLEVLPKLGMIGSAFPFLLRIAATIPIPYFTDATKAGSRIAEYADQAIEAYRAATAKETSSPKPTLFTKLFHSDADGLSDVEIGSEAQGYIVGGSDNTAITLTFLVWAVCRDDKIKAAILEEVSKLPSDFKEADLKKLPFLNHVVKETLRLYATNPSSRPRQVPSPGATLNGYWVPDHVTVSTQAFSLHRDSEIFVQPETFNPWRWEATTKEMNRAFMPFGGGSRICLGLHLAEREIRLGAAHFFRTFPNAKLSQKEGMSDSDMEQLCYFIMSPVGKRCLIDLGIER